jgi:Tol biopolymer transport system component
MAAHHRLFGPAAVAVIALAGCASSSASGAAPSAVSTVVPHEARWGIYSLRLDSGAVTLIYGTPDELSGLALNSAGDRFAFARKVGGTADEDSEIFSLAAGGGEPVRLTDNRVLDTYPAWSPDGSRIAYLSMGKTLDIKVMNADGSGARLLYDSGGHDADISWVGDRIAFTRDSRIWIMGDDGQGAGKLTDPPRAGEWGKANLPFGDYDPRISPDGSRIVFERLVADDSPNGNYDLYAMAADGSGVTALTNNGYSQGLAAWSPSGSLIAYIVAAIDGTGAYDIYVMNADGSDNHDATPAYFPPEFLCRGVTFGTDDATLYFIGEWWS